MRSNRRWSEWRIDAVVRMPLRCPRVPLMSVAFSTNRFRLRLRDSALTSLIVCNAAVDQHPGLNYQHPCFNYQHPNYAAEPLSP